MTVSINELREYAKVTLRVTYREVGEFSYPSYTVGDAYALYASMCTRVFLKEGCIEKLHQLGLNPDIRQSGGYPPEDYEARARTVFAPNDEVHTLLETVKAIWSETLQKRSKEQRPGYLRAVVKAHRAERERVLTGMGLGSFFK